MFIPVKLYIFIHNEVRDFDKNSTQPEIRVSRIRDNESQLYFVFLRSVYCIQCLQLPIPGCPVSFRFGPEM
jgi:hypothetical protein